jgi:HK97 family phage prohead protease
MSTQKKLEVRFQAELRKAKSGSRTLRGYAAKFNSRSLPIPGNGGVYVEQLAPGCFAACLSTDTEIRALIDHDHTRILARRSTGSLRISEDSIGLAVEFDLPATSYADDLLACVEADLIAGMSFGMYIQEDRWQKVSIDGQDWAERTVTRADVFEVTATSMPCYEATTLSTRSYFPDGLPAEVEMQIAAAQRSHKAQAVISQHSAWLKSEQEKTSELEKEIAQNTLRLAVAKLTL